MSPIPESSGLMKKRSNSTQGVNTHDVSVSVPGVCSMHSTVGFWLLYPSVQLSPEALLAYCGQCFVPGLSVVSFN